MSGQPEAGGACARLLGRVGETRGIEHEVGAEATIGRNAGNSVVVPSPLVSGEHARIVYEAEPGCYFLEDLGSLNGTELDGAPVDGRERLGRLHVIRLGGAAELIYQGPEVRGGRAAAPAAGTTAAAAVMEEAAGEPAATTAEAAGGEPAAAAEEPSATAEPGPGTAPFVLVVDLAGSRRRFPLRQGINLLGRSRQATVRIDNPGISRRHAVLTVEEDRVRLRDEGSSNHTFAGGRRLTGEVTVEPGVELRFGKIPARLERSSAVDR